MRLQLSSLDYISGTWTRSYQVSIDEKEQKMFRRIDQKV